MDYTNLTIDRIPAELERTVADVRTSFGRLDARQLNWRPGADAWSVAQCAEHLVHTNREVCRVIHNASDPAHGKTIWQRLPLLPRVYGRMLVASQGPRVTRKFTAPAAAAPSASAIEAGILKRFVDGQQEVIALARALAGRDPARVVMVSPFNRFITYSVLDGLRLIVAHERRHYEQALRVMETAGFPRTSEAR
jgi:uncharacterized damage-inducible protein DinB